MQKISLEALARQQMKLAATAAGRHTADTVYGGHEKVLRQTVIGMIAGARLAEHENRLRGWLSRREERAEAQAEYAFYNSPMIPPPLRRTEVLIPLG